MNEKLYADYVKQARLCQRPLLDQEHFFKAVKMVADMCQEDPFSTGILEADAMELVVMLDKKEVA
jgi:hypothetical protein